MTAVDYKKLEKQYYIPKTKPEIIQIPKMKFLMVDGKGNPNTSKEYSESLEILYGLSYAIKMTKMSGNTPEGYFDYVVLPLEGLWWTENEEFKGEGFLNKDNFLWTSMIRQPDFVTPEVLEKAKEVLLKKKPQLDISKVRLVEFEEGLCAQILHLGPYDDEPATIAKLVDFVNKSGYVEDFEIRKHHEIYLGDPRKTKPENLKTVIRHPVKK